MTIGENIRKLRNERGLTCKQLGEMIGKNEAYIRAYEKGRRNPKLQSLILLAHALKVDVATLIEGTVDPGILSRKE